MGVGWTQFKPPRWNQDVRKVQKHLMGFFLLILTSKGKKTKHVFRPPCIITAQGLAPPEPSCRFNGCNLKSALWEKPRPLIIIAEIQFQPGHERISTWKKKRHFNWPGPFERKEVVKLKCRSNYSLDWRVFTHLLTSRTPCFCVPSVFEGFVEWTELGDKFSYQGIRWKYHN